MARARPAARGHRGRRLRARPAAHRSTPSSPLDPDRWLDDRPCASRCSTAATPRASAATTRARASRRRSGEVRNVGDGAEVVLVGRRSTAWYSRRRRRAAGARARRSRARPARRGRRGARRRARSARSPARTRSSRCSRARGREVAAVAEVADELRPPTVRRRRHLRAQPQHQLHERVHVQVPVLRLLQGPAVAQPARHALPAHARRHRRPRRARRGTCGATEVCLQGGIHPDFDGDYYIDVTRAVKEAAPDIHVHGFTALEVTEGAKRLGEPLADYLRRLMDAGLRSLPGTAAEILDDEVRAVLCPDKIDTEEWLDAHETAHAVGLRSNVTIMFGVDRAAGHWARHLVRTRDLQKRDRRVHRVRAAAVRAHGGADLPPAQGPPRPDVPRGRAHARRRPHRLPRLDRQHPGVVGEARRGRRPPAAAGRRQRPRRHADGREHLPGRRRQPRPEHGRRGFRALVEPLGRRSSSAPPSTRPPVAALHG